MNFQKFLDAPVLINTLLLMFYIYEAFVWVATFSQVR